MNKIYVLGSINMDMVIKTPYMPKNGETLTGSDFLLNSGGKGANQAVAASKQDVLVHLIASVGNDVFGNDLIKTLSNYNVDVTYIDKLEDTSTGVAMIIIENKDNRIILDGGANRKISNEQIDKALVDAKENDIFITQLENNIDAVLYGLKKAKEKGMITIFNPAPAIKLENEFYSYVDYLIVNETECEILTTIDPVTIEDKKKAYKALCDLGVKNLIITLGSKGSICFAGNEVIEVKANKVDAIDTTAAGDTFVGTLASKLINNASLKEALDYASICSSLTCLKNGAQQSIPTLKEVNEYLKNR